MPALEDDQDVARITAINIAPGARLAMRSVQQATAETDRGLVGDRYHGARDRQISVQSEQDLIDGADILGSPITPSGTRRNLTISHGRIPTTPVAESVSATWCSK